MRLRFGLLLIGLLVELNLFSRIVTPALIDLHEYDSLRMCYVSDPGCCAELLKEADNLITISCPTVVEKKHSFSDSKHNYESLAIYYWPNPDNPSGPYIVKDGVLNPEYKEYDNPRLFLLRKMCNVMAKAYYITREKKYALKFKEIINTWFIDADTYMQPNMDYAQIRLGHEIKGEYGGISEAICFIDVLDDIALMRQIGAINKRTTKKLQHWFDFFSYWLENSELGKRMSATQNNLGIDYDILLYRIALFTGNTSICQYLYENIYSRRMVPQIDANGMQPKEIVRTRSYYYSIYNLEHIVDFWEMCQKDGYALPENSLSLIDKAYSFLAQFVGHRERYAYSELDNWSSLEEKMRLLGMRINKMRGNISCKRSR